MERRRDNDRKDSERQWGAGIHIKRSVNSDGAKREEEEEVVVEEEGGGGGGGRFCLKLTALGPDNKGGWVRLVDREHPTSSPYPCGSL